MPKKSPTPNTGIVAAYIRKSDVQFPPDCITPEQHAAYVDDLRRVRVQELISDAARDNLTIDLWFDDMGISGRGEYLSKRLAFEQARLDAKAGKIRILYARDLSRLFRDLVQQELWFSEMELYGCEVRIQDLPFIADLATRTLLRQNIGAINQYLATRGGELIKATNAARVLSGQWVGRGHSQLGLRYDKEIKGFRYDQETAGRAIAVFEAFNASYGFARRAATLLNSQGIRTINGFEWGQQQVIHIVRSPLYRRRATYEDIVVEAPDLIPEVIPADILAETDRLLELRSPENAALRDKLKASRLDYTYGAGILRCGYCGAKMRALRNPKSSATGVRWLSWICAKLDDNKPHWPGHLSAQQFRIDPLVQHAVGLAMARHDRRRQEERKQAAKRPRKRDPSKELAAIERKQEKLYDLYLDPEAGMSKESFTSRYASLAQEKQRILDNQISDLEELPSAFSLTDKEWKRLQENFDEAWRSDPNEPLNMVKHDLLRSLGAVIDVKVNPRETNERAEGNHRTYGGTISISIQLPMLETGSINVDESDEAFSSYLQWRREGLRGKKLSRLKT